MLEQRNCWKAKQSKTKIKCKKSTQTHMTHSCKKVNAERDCHDGKSGFSVYSRCFDAVVWFSFHLFGFYLSLLCMLYTFMVCQYYSYGFCFLNFTSIRFCAQQSNSCNFCGSIAIVNWHMAPSFMQMMACNDLLRSSHKI